MMEPNIAELVQGFENGRITRRELIRSLSLLVTAAGLPSTLQGQSPPPHRFKATGVNHISFVVSDYARTRDFYADLFSMRVERDDPKAKQCWLYLADGTHVVVRNQRNQRRNSGSAENPPLVDHFGVGIADWNKAALEAELKRRGITYQVSEGLPNDAIHLVDPDGYDFELVNEKVQG